MKPKFFKTGLAFRNWLAKNYAKESELIVGYYKVGSGKASMTWSESVDQALCFGWIDGVRKGIDSESYQIRFTPRSKKSIWSALNCKKVESLIKLGLMHPAGLESYKHRSIDKTGVYSFEKEFVKIPKDFEKLFKTNEKAWKYFESLAISYKKASWHWVLSAKQEKTQMKRLLLLIGDSEKGVNQWKANTYKNQG